MLDQKSFIYGVLSVADNDDISYRYDRKFYAFSYKGQPLGWIAEEELMWVMRTLLKKPVRSLQDLLDELDARYKVEV